MICQNNCLRICLRDGDGERGRDLQGDFRGIFIIPTALDGHGTIDSHALGYNATSPSGHDPSKYFDKLYDVAWILSEESSKAYVPFVAFLAGRAGAIM